MTTITLINIIFGLSLVAWFFIFYTSIFGFDDPNHHTQAWLVAVIVWSYPVIVALSIYYSRVRQSVMLSLLPLVNIAIFLAIFLPGNIKQGIKYKATSDKMYNTASKDFVCTDGSFLSIQGFDVTYFPNIAEGGQPIGFFTAKDNSTINFYQKLTTEQTQLFESCKNKDNKSIFDIYKTKN